MSTHPLWVSPQDSEESAEHQWFSHSVVCCPPAVLFHTLHPSFLATALYTSQSCLCSRPCVWWLCSLGRWGQEELCTLLLGLLMLRISDSFWKRNDNCVLLKWEPYSWGFTLVSWSMSFQRRWIVLEDCFVPLSREFQTHLLLREGSRKDWLVLKWPTTWWKNYTV